LRCRFCAEVLRLLLSSHAAPRYGLKNGLTVKVAPVKKSFRLVAVDFLLRRSRAPLYYGDQQVKIMKERTRP